MVQVQELQEYFGIIFSSVNFGVAPATQINWMISTFSSLLISSTYLRKMKEFINTGWMFWVSAEIFKFLLYFHWIFFFSLMDGRGCY